MQLITVGSMNFITSICTVHNTLNFINLPFQTNMDTIPGSDDLLLQLNLSIFKFKNIPMYKSCYAMASYIFFKPPPPSFSQINLR